MPLPWEACASATGAGAIAEGADDGEPPAGPSADGGGAVALVGTVAGTAVLDGTARPEVFTDAVAVLVGAVPAGAGEEGGADGGADGAAGAVAEGLGVLEGCGVGVAEGSHRPSGTSMTGPQGSAWAGAAMARALKVVMARAARAGAPTKVPLRVLILDILRFGVQCFRDFRDFRARS